MSATIIPGDALEQLRLMPDESVNCIVTSPPYWQIRDYGVAGQIGLEPTLQEFIARLVAVFAEARRVLTADGVAWVNMGDTYATNKSLVGQPWRLAFALQDDGWYLRQDIIWSKPNPMPESVTDRCTKAHDYLFMLTKSEHYWSNFEAIKERASTNTHARKKMPDGWNTGAGAHGSFHPNGREKGSTRKLAEPGSGTKANLSFDAAVQGMVDFRNKRSVWEVGSEAYSEAHFATFPRALIRPCVIATCPQHGIVLDPFNGSGTTGQVALELGRKYIGIELNPEYIALTEQRLKRMTMGLALEAV